MFVEFLKSTRKTNVALIVPSITVSDPVEFGQKINRLKFAKRLHIDTGTPPFLPNRLVGLAQMHFPDGIDCDLHLMMDHPERQIETIISLGPKLAIIHFEAEGSKAAFFDAVKAVGIKTGLALLPETTVEEAAELVKTVDHILVFTGKLGYYGGELQFDCLPKIAQIKQLNPDAEVSVDGGINPDNADRVVEAGADILISGGFIANADDPKSAYRELMEAAGG